jgi:hypothetical protein
MTATFHVIRYQSLRRQRASNGAAAVASHRPVSHAESTVPVICTNARFSITRASSQGRRRSGTRGLPLGERKFE